MLSGSASDVAHRIADIVKRDDRMSGVLVIAESRQGELREISRELIGAALGLKDQAGGRVAVAVIGQGAGGHAEALGRPVSTSC